MLRRSMDVLLLGEDDDQAATNFLSLFTRIVLHPTVLWQDQRIVLAAGGLVADGSRYLSTWRPRSDPLSLSPATTYP